MKTQKKGFTLIEMVVTIVIILILSGIGYHFYKQQIVQTRRLEAQTALLEMAVRMEAYYSHSTPPSYSQARLNDLYRDQKSMTPHGWYTLAIEKQTDTAYTLTATANDKIREEDEACVTFVLTEASGKQARNRQNEVNNECW